MTRASGIGPGEAARRLGVSTRTVQRWLREGRLPGVQVGNRLKVAATALPDGEPTRWPVARKPIRRLLVANRGELVVRIARTTRRLGIRCLALVPDDQAGAWWTRAPDEIISLAGTYLDPEAVLTAATAAGADAIHPGYGFLAENHEFASAVAASGLTWVGPPPAAMRALGDKAEARRLAADAGVSVLPGYDGDDQSDEALCDAAERIGYPVLVKPSGGGGGKGMHVVRDIGELDEALARARREAVAAFGDGRLILEGYVAAPHHIEIQILCDSHGGAVHLGERECSLQRRHQKVIEESPSPIVDDRLREALGGAALSLARRAGYEGAGTAEFLVDDEGRWYFLELNARLQVEHPVTEMITGRDLVADQLRLAAGEPLGFAQADVAMRGHAMEARLYAEDADAGFVPSMGDVLDVRWPEGAGIRVDAGVGAGDSVGVRYDPLLAKVIAHGDTREEALARLRAALDETSVVGVTTNRGFLRWLLDRPEVAAGDAHTQFIDEHWVGRPADVPEAAWRHAAEALAGNPSGTVPTGFRVNQPPRVRIEIGGDQRSVAVGARDVERPSGEVRWVRSTGEEVVLDLDGRAVRARLAPAPSVASAARQQAHGAASDVVRSPMPGRILQVLVADGDAVEAGGVLLVLEAMKMENQVPAPAAAIVARVLVAVGQQVQRGDPLVELA